MAEASFAIININRLLRNKQKLPNGKHRSSENYTNKTVVRHQYKKLQKFIVYYSVPAKHKSVGFPFGSGVWQDKAIAALGKIRQKMVKDFAESGRRQYAALTFFIQNYAFHGHRRTI